MMGPASATFVSA